MRLEDLRSEVGIALRRFLDAALQHLRDAAPSLAENAAVLDNLADRGKRIRPLLVLTGHRLVTGDHEPAMGPALATELLHLCALLHDDVIDAATTRRGHPSFHVSVADRHRAAGWPGDADAHGRAAAILFGDLALVLADEVFFDSRLPADQLIAAHRVFSSMKEEVMRGQSLDVEAAARGAASIDEALAIARDKSGRYTIRRPVEIGASLGGAPPAVLAALGAWAEPLGVAFQLTDDLLGVFGDAAVTGKDPTTDLREGKRTVLVAETLRAVPADVAERFNALLGDDGIDEVEVDWLRRTITQSGAADAVRSRVRALVNDSWRALAALDGLALDETGLALLREATDEVADRTH